MQIASGRPGWARTGRCIAVQLALWAAVVGLFTTGLGCHRRRPGTDRGSAASDGRSVSGVAVALAGRVADRGARPIPDARVLLFPEAGRGENIETSTDPQGHFRASGLVPGRYRVIVEAAGFPTAEQASVAVPGDDLPGDPGRGGPAASRPGRAGGAPLAGARVLLGPDEGGPIREAISPARRRLRLWGPRPWALRPSRGGRGGRVAGDPGRRSHRGWPRPGGSPFTRAGPLVAGRGSTTPPWAWRASTFAWRARARRGTIRCRRRTDRRQWTVFGRAGGSG